MKPIALVTGASRGIGKEIARKLAKEGYQLHLTCRNNITSLHEFAMELTRNYGTTCRCIPGNIGDPEFVRDLFENIPKLDLLVNNAGISYVGLLQDMTDAAWEDTISVNLSAAFYTSREAIKRMLPEGKGKIINISSVWGNQGASMEVAYCASKGGINSFTMALAKELAPSNIQVNAIACGLIDTEMNGHLSEEEMKELIDEIPANRIGKPEEVADMVYQIVQSPSYLTGQIITMDGGWI